MFIRNSIIAFVSLLAETSGLFLPYYLFSILVKIPMEQMISFSCLLLLILTAGILNFLISFRSCTLLKIVAINLVSAILVLVSLLPHTLPAYLTMGTGLLFKGSNPGDSLHLWLIVCLTGWIFFRAMIIFISTTAYQKAVNRLEIVMGIVWGTALLAELLSIPMPNIITVLVFCLVFNLTAVALTRSKGVYFQGYITALGILVGLVSILILLLDLSHSLMLSGSQQLYNSIFPYVGLLFYNAITWLLKKGHYLPDQSSSVTSSSAPLSSSGFSGHSSAGQPHWIDLLASYIDIIAIIALTLMSLAVGFYVVKRLLRKRNCSSAPAFPEVGFSGLSIKLGTLLKRFGVLMLLFKPGQVGIDLLYQGLLYWGKRKNVAREDFETPYEYCNRLSISFPRHRERFLQITDAYVGYRFGQESPEPLQLKELCRSFRQLLRHPF